MTLNKIGQLFSVLEINPGLSAPILTIDLQWNTVVLFPCFQMVYVGRIRSVCLPIEPPLKTLICYLNVAWAEVILNSTALTSLRMGESTELQQLLTHVNLFFCTDWWTQQPLKQSEWSFHSLYKANFRPQALRWFREEPPPGLRMQLSLCSLWHQCSTICCARELLVRNCYFEGN